MSEQYEHADVLAALEHCARHGGSRAERARYAAELIRRAGGYRWAGLYDVTPTEIAALSWTGAEAPAFPRFPAAQGLNGAAVAARAPVIVNDVTEDPRYLTTFGSTRAEMIVPVVGPAGDVIGTIDVESDRVNAFTDRDSRFLARCAAALAPLWIQENPEAICA